MAVGGRGTGQRQWRRRCGGRRRRPRRRDSPASGQAALDVGDIGNETGAGGCTKKAAALSGREYLPIGRTASRDVASVGGKQHREGNSNLRPRGVFSKGEGRTCGRASIECSVGTTVPNITSAVGDYASNIKIDGGPRFYTGSRNGFERLGERTTKRFI